MNIDHLHLQLQDARMLSLSIRAHPGAPKNQIKAIMADGTLKIDVAAAPEDGEANDELCRFLAETFGVPRRNVTLLAGATSRRKMVELTLG